jgi:hypothetical protein
MRPIEPYIKPSPALPLRKSFCGCRRSRTKRKVLRQPISIPVYLLTDGIAVPAIAADLARNKSTRSTYNQLKAELGRAEEPWRQPPGADRQAELDDEYVLHL